MRRLLGRAAEAYWPYLYLAYSRFLAGKGLGRLRGSSSFSRLEHALTPGRALIRCHGHKLYVNMNDRYVAPALLRGVYERTETELFERALDEGMRVLDIGANVGYYTLLAARLVGPSGMVYAFEPERSNFQLLVENITLNRYTNVVAVEKAVSNTCGRTELFLDPENFGGHSLSRHAVLHESKPVTVETVTLDDFLRGTDDMHVDVVKIDVQGAEGLALDGARQMLALNPKVRIFMEFWPYALENLHTPPEEVIRLLESAGLNRIQTIDEERGATKNIAAQELLRMCDGRRTDAYFWLNLLVRNSGDDESKNLFDWLS